MENQHKIQQSCSHKHFTVSSDKEKIVASLELMLAYISEVVGVCGTPDSILLRSKWILAELLTNASKHCNNDLVEFEIQFTGAMLQITKTDTGEPFSVVIDNERKSFPQDFCQNEKYIIHKDDLCVLSATISADNLLTFEANDIDVICDTVQDVNEHFGLIIIIKASDRFVYRYDSVTKTNVFTASLAM